MSDQLISSVVTVLTAIIGVAIIATLVSKNANTTGVIQAGGSAFSSALGVALSPVTGGNFTGGGGGLSLTTP
jgi:PRD1 phage membrane DNA delivery